jgi:hypothetical protein
LSPERTTGKNGLNNILYDLFALIICSKTKNMANFMKSYNSLYDYIKRSKLPSNNIFDINILDLIDKILIPFILTSENKEFKQRFDYFTEKENYKMFFHLQKHLLLQLACIIALIIMKAKYSKIKGSLENINTILENLRKSQCELDKCICNSKFFFNFR